MLKSDVNQITAGAGAVLARQLEADITGSDRFVSQSSTEKRARVTELHHRTAIRKLSRDRLLGNVAALNVLSALHGVVRVADHATSTDSLWRMQLSITWLLSRTGNI